MLAQGCVPQNPAIRWARVVVRFHPDGSPRSLLRFPVHVERTGAAIDWEVPWSEF